VFVGIGGSSQSERRQGHVTNRRSYRNFTAVRPLPLDHPIRKLDNVVLTPHLGYVTAENYRRYYGGMVEDIKSWLDGKPIRVMSA
jgi:phosphoglycerate dehydrogenase-like enzyme